MKKKKIKKNKNHMREDIGKGRTDVLMVFIVAKEGRKERGGFPHSQVLQSACLVDEVSFVKVD